MPAGLDGNPDPVVSTARAALLGRVADRVLRLTPAARKLVGIDGASGTGKSTFADELERTLAQTGRTTVRATIDSFHRPRRERYRRGADSPEGYYLDSHDIDSVVRLLFDGLFLHRPELAGDWDLSVCLLADSRRERAWQDYLHRDLPTDTEARANEIARRTTAARRRRYLDGHDLYERDAAPRLRASLVVHNDDLKAPVVVAER